MPLFDPSDDGSGFMSGLGGLMGKPEVQAFLGSLGDSLMSSPRGAPLSGFSQAYAANSKMAEQAQQRLALAALLKRAGINDPSLANLSPGLAGLAIQLGTQEKQTKADADADAQLERSRGGVGAGGAGSTGDKISLGEPGEVENKFVAALREGGLTNPHGLGAVAAYGQAESQYAPGNVGRSWSDPSQSGQPGTSGGIMSWRNERLDNMRKATAGADDPISAQARFMLSENPALTQALQNAQSPQEAHRLMADAWKFAGYDQPGGEAGKRLLMTQAYSNRFGKDAQPTRVAGMDGTAAGSEAEVQAAERASGMMPGGSPLPPARPTQFAQAGGATASDAPAPGAREAQFAIPGSQPAGDPMLYPSKKAALDAVAMYEGVLRRQGISDTKRKEIEGRRSEAVQFLNRQGPLADIDAAYPGGDPRRQQALDRKFLGETNRIPQEVQQRAEAAGRMGLTEGSPEHRAYVLTGKLPESVDKITDDMRQRAEAAKVAGLKEGTPAWRSYMLTGKPTEISASDRKAIMDTEDQIPLIDNTLTTLNRAKELNFKTFTGMGADRKGWIGTSVPGAGLIIDQDKAKATREFGQLMTQEAITSMAQTLKGATTDKEMSRFIEILGDPTTPPELRERTLDRMISLAERQKGIASSRVKELRSQNYFDADRPNEEPRSAPQAAPREPERQVAPQRQEAPAFREGMTATNPQTKEQVIFRGGKWVPVNARPQT